MAGVGFVVGLNFLGREQARAGHVAIPVIGLGRAVGRRCPSGLRPGRGVEAVRVHDAADLREGAIEHQVRGRVRTGLELALDDLAGLQRHHDLMLRLHAVVGHAGWLDDDEAALAVDPADVAPGLNDQAFRHEIEVGLADFRFEFFEHRQATSVARLRISMSSFITSYSCRSIPSCRRRRAAAVERVELLVNRVALRVRLEDLRLQAGHRLLRGGVIRMRAGHDRAGDGRAQRAGLRRAARPSSGRPVTSA